MEGNQSASPAPAKSGNRNVIIIVVVAVVLCCCCLVVGAGGYYYYTSNMRASANFPSVVSPSSGVPESQGNGDLPQGGITDDLLRTDTWNYVGVAALAQNCQAVASGTTIEVTQTPDSSGVWIERWTAACSDGGTKAFDVTFTPDPNGGTNFHIESAK